VPPRPAGAVCAWSLLDVGGVRLAARRLDALGGHELERLGDEVRERRRERAQQPGDAGVDDGGEAERDAAAASTESPFIAVPSEVTSDGYDGRVSRKPRVTIVSSSVKPATAPIA
jgi:hypothetical protein